MSEKEVRAEIRELNNRISTLETRLSVERQRNYELRRQLKATDLAVGECISGVDALRIMFGVAGTDG